jgi:HK97 family phage major capsid protein
MTTTMRNFTDLLAEADQVLRNSTNQSFDRAAEARVDRLLRLAELTRAGEIRQTDIFGKPRSIADSARRAQEQYFERTIDNATLAFFRGHRGSSTREERRISVSGGMIYELRSVMNRGRPVGAVTELRDFSSVMAPENRTYAGLTTAGGTDGGNAVPIGFIPTVFAAMKRTDQILEAANWETCATTDGRPTNLPNLTDTSTSALKVAESGPQTFANPTAFGSLNWPSASTWSSQVIVASIQLDEDAGVKLASVLADAFRIRFARGFGADAVATIIGDAPIGATTASPTAITQPDLLELVKSVDPAYAAADSAGWSMNWNTLLYVFENVVTTASGGDALYHAKRDDQGHYLLLGRPVYVSPSLDDIGAGKKPVLYGDWSRFLIRHVPTEAVVRRYDELFMKNMQLGYEMLFRADSAIMHAGGPGDDPIKILQCHA